MYKKRSPRFKFLTASMLAIALSLTACGGESSDAVDDGGTAPNETAPTSTEDSSTGGSDTNEDDAQAAGDQGNLKSVTFSLPARSVGWTAHYLAAERGFWAEEGLDVTLETMTPSTAVAGAISGQVEYVGALGSTLRSAVNGSGLVILAAAVDKSPFRLVAQEDYPTVPDLAGTQLGVTNVGSSTHFFAIDFLRNNGLDDSEVTFINCNTTETCRQVFEAGAIAATVLSPPHSQLAIRDAGGIALSSADDFPPDEPANGLATHRDYLEANREEAVGMARGLIRALEFLKSEREETIAFIEEYFNLETDVAEAAYEDLVAASSEDGSVTAEVLQKGVDRYREEADVSAEFDASEALDPSIWKDAMSSE